MKKLLLLFVMMLLPLVASADAVLIDGIYYFLYNEAKTAEVSRNPNYGQTDYCQGDVTIPETVVFDGQTYSVTGIGDYAFESCRRITSVTIPNSVTSISTGAFMGCTGLTTIDIPDGVTVISDAVFGHCTGLTSIDIPDGVTSIGYQSFEYCIGLTSITIPNSVTSIANYAFNQCSGLTSVALGSRVTTIGNQAFFECTSLTSIDIPDGVSKIGDSAFAGCTSLTTATIGSGLISVGSYAFGDCKNLISITVDEANPYLKSVDGILMSKDERALMVYPAGKTETSYSIPNSVTLIGEGAFASCRSLTSIDIPSSTTLIGQNAFNWCNSLTAITVDNANTAYKSVEGVLMSKDGTTLIVYPGGKTATEFSIPNGVTSIASSAFGGCINLITVTIPNTVTSIGDNAFIGCSGLTSIAIPEGVTVINALTFNSCTSLAKVIIPSTVTSIGMMAFAGCNLSDVYCYAEQIPATQTWDYVFSWSNQENATLHVPASAIESYKVTKPWSDFGSIVELAPTTPGDVNGDSETNVGDIVTVCNVMAGNSTVDPQLADVNKDGEVNVGDIVTICNIMAGKNNAE